MVFGIICSFLSLVLVLFLKSFFKSKGAFTGCQSDIQDAEVRNGVFSIPSTAIGTLESGCKAYIIQSLYSKDFILPEDAGLKYKFRDPLPSFDGGYITYSIAPNSCSRSLFTQDENPREPGAMII